MNTASSPIRDPLGLVKSRQLVLEPQPGCDWAREMVLNPAAVQDPNTGRLHMLFRATGPYTHRQIPGRPLPFPIFLGYAWSDDKGCTWQVDWSRPALAPALADKIEGIHIHCASGRRAINHANGCIEDPRLFFLEGQCYVTVACRMFRPGPYWLHDDPMQCAPDWARSRDNPFGIAASGNVTVSVLFRVDLAKLAAGAYEQAFEYIIHLTDPAKGENRDVLLFPEQLTVAGRKQYVCIHRPWHAGQYAAIGGQPHPPTMVICAADRIEDIWKEEASQTVLAGPRFAWEADRVGASGPLVKLPDGEWLLSYHGKKDTQEGYTQSFMILKARPNELPVVKHRCSDRIMYPLEA